MSSANALSEEIAKLQRIQASLISISSRYDERRKLDLVNLRRELALQIGTISEVARTGFLTTASKDDAREFRNLLSEMRRAVALHQANFPAVKLDEQSAEYEISVRSVRQANACFIQWAELHLQRNF